MEAILEAFKIFVWIEVTVEAIAVVIGLGLLIFMVKNLIDEMRKDNNP